MSSELTEEPVTASVWSWSEFHELYDRLQTDSNYANSITTLELNMAAGAPDTRLIQDDGDLDFLFDEDMVYEHQFHSLDEIRSALKTVVESTVKVTTLRWCVEMLPPESMMRVLRRKGTLESLSIDFLRSDTMWEPHWGIPSLLSLKFTFLHHSTGPIAQVLDSLPRLTEFSMSHSDPSPIFDNQSVFPKWAGVARVHCGLADEYEGEEELVRDMSLTIGPNGENVGVLRACKFMRRRIAHQAGGAGAECTREHVRALAEEEVFAPVKEWLENEETSRKIVEVYNASLRTSRGI